MDVFTTHMWTTCMICIHISRENNEIIGWSLEKVGMIMCHPWLVGNWGLTRGLLVYSIGLIWGNPKCSKREIICQYSYHGNLIKHSFKYINFVYVWLWPITSRIWELIVSVGRSHSHYMKISASKYKIKYHGCYTQLYCNDFRQHCGFCHIIPWYG